MDSRLLQLSDSAFPSGAFAHSFGFEALRQLGHLRGEESLKARLSELIWHTARGALPFLNDAHAADAAAVDKLAHAFLANHVANRASRAQGQSFLLAAEATFESKAVMLLREQLPYAHVAVAMGAALKAAALPLSDARQLFLFGAVRGALSATVRLGVVGGLRAQKLLFNLHHTMTRALAETASMCADEATGCAPLLEVSQGAQDRLYSRLFQS